ncbi:hypothetical protein PF010_g20468 [Phytophthora fragariae]|uniref:Uncharacterized protein n=1 Tax=Phytophthora fragariae TaxID=53985 RepID=A0A6G0KF23_9STRA|nr:hypothetical protein PF010_g20468 [Phytophthora fragariae]
MAVGGALQVKPVTPSGVISSRATVAIGLGTALGYVASAIALAALWTFPVPFGYALMIIPPLSVLAAQGVLAGCYPPFYAVFRQLSGVQQTAFVAVMPLIKTLCKQYIARVSAHLQEHIGPTVVFSVDVCNVLYSVICMQTAVSSLTSILMIGSDVLFIVLVLRSIYQVNSARVWPEPALLSSIRTRRSNYLQFLPELVRQAFQSADSRDDPSHPIRVCAQGLIATGDTR